MTTLLPNWTILSRTARKLTPHSWSFSYPCLYLCHDSTGTDSADTVPVDLRKVTHKDLKKMCSGMFSVSKLTTADINIVGTGGIELSPSFYLNCIGRSYLFNCGEGYTRMSENHHITRKFNQPITFFTRACWENVSGCVSLYENLQVSYVQQEYCGPPKIAHYIEYVRKFTGKDSWSDIRKYESGKPSEFEDKYLKMCIIDLDHMHMSDPMTLSSIVAYSCKLTNMPGKFLPEKALEMGIKPGPVYRLFTAGKSVITRNGDLVLPSQVMTSAQVGPTFLVVDCPTESVISAITSNQYLQPEWYTTRGEDVKLIVHITPLDVLQNEAYCKWMASFTGDTEHLFLHASLCPGEVGHRGAMRLSLPFHLLNPNIFHFPHVPDQNIVNKDDLNVSKYVDKESIIFGRLFMKYHLKPSICEDSSSCLEAIDERLKKDINRNSQLFPMISALGDESVVPSLVKNEYFPTPTLTDPDDALVTMLGTSSAMPSITRNVSGILVQTLTDGNILLDCGEGTLCQLYKSFGHMATHDILRRLNVIFISHTHGDHHVGLIRVLEEIKRLTEDDKFKVVTIVCDRQYSSRLKEYSHLCGGIVRCEVVDSVAASKIAYPCGGDVTLETVPVKHNIKFAFGIVLRKRGKWSIVYSGDTMPCRELVNVGQNATLLIHEATLEDTYFEEARKKGHCTFSEAVAVSRAMNARSTIMTHFSCRYMLYTYRSRHWGPNILPGVDLMSVRVSDFHKHYSIGKKVFNTVARVGFEELDMP